PPAGKMERNERRALSDAIRDHRLDLDLRAGGRLDPDVLAVAHAAIVGVDRIDLDEILLLQLGEPAVAARLVPAALVFDETATGQDERVLLRHLVLDVRVLHGLVE